MDNHVKQYHTNPDHVFFAPARLNLLGTHTSSSGGYTLSLPLDLGITLYLSERKDDKIRLWSDQFIEDGVNFLDETIAFHERFIAVIDKLAHESYPVHKGFDITIKSSIPMNHGFSSSAALIVCFMGAMIELNGYEMPKERLLRFANYVDQKCSHIPVSFSHQITAIYGEKNYANLIFCQDLDINKALFDFEQYSLIIFNTNLCPSHLAFTIKERYLQIHEGTKIITRHRPISSLCEVDYPSFSQLRHQIQDKDVLRRIEHVIFENSRVVQGYDALLIHEYHILGDLMNQSQNALKALFDMSTPEIDFVVEANRQFNAYGVRMIGPGKGGAVVALYPKDLVPDFTDIKASYEKRFKRTLDIQTVASSDGFHRV